MGVDIGGTFTDVAVLDEANGWAGIAKVSTTPSDFGAAVIAGIRAAMDEYRIAPGSVTLLSHATTIVTNALLESRGASVALVATRGFRSVRIARAPSSASVPTGPGCLLPGSFDPVHDRHRGMLETAAARLGTSSRAAFELAIVNPDKPPLCAAETARRLARFSGHEAIWLTRAPTFAEKARIFPGATFVIGVDTIVRVASPRYYGGPEGFETAVSILRACRFLVFGRRGGAGFETLGSVALPDSLRALCDGVPEVDFRADVSSTELRRMARFPAIGGQSGDGKDPADTAGGLAGRHEHREV